MSADFRLGEREGEEAGGLLESPFHTVDDQIILGYEHVIFCNFSFSKMPSVYHLRLCNSHNRRRKISLYKSNKMKLSLALLIPAVAALAPGASTRRQLFGTIAASGAALISPQVSNAGLLDDFGADPTKINQKPSEPVLPKSQKKVESTIEPNLRSNYYYPTNKKRYLPRIKKCNDAIPIVAGQIGDGDWASVEEFVVKVADDTILPMKLYTSSLTGGGTNVKVSYTKGEVKK